MKYIYPDVNDNLTLRTIQTFEPYPGYWNISEQMLLERIRSKMSGGLGAMLDAGCGEGRLIPVFADLFESITAIEPDGERLANAVKFSRRKKWAGKTDFVKTDIESFETSRRFDFILCSHIIQHVHTSSVSRILSILGNLLATGGRLAIMTNHSTEKNDYFLKSFSEGESIREERISAAQFDRLINNQTGILPIHCFTRKNLTELLEKAGLTVTDFYCFHCFGDFGDPERFVHRDLIVNAFPALQAKFGRDIYLEAMKI